MKCFHETELQAIYLNEKFLVFIWRLSLLWKYIVIDTFFDLNTLFKKKMWKLWWFIDSEFMTTCQEHVICFESKILHTFLTSSISSYQTITRKIVRWVWITFTACVVTVFSLLNIVIQNTGWTAFPKVKLAFCNVCLLVAETISKQWICYQV